MNFKSVSLVVCAMLLAACASPVAEEGTQETESALTGGGGGGGGGGVKPGLPVGWPASVPVPAGKITGNRVAPLGVGVLVDGEYQAVMAQVVALYTSAGFTQLPSIGFNFENATYGVSAVGFNHDHTGAPQTDVTVLLYLK